MVDPARIITYSRTERVELSPAPSLGVSWTVLACFQICHWLSSSAADNDTVRKLLLQAGGMWTVCTQMEQAISMMINGEQSRYRLSRELFSR